MNYEEIIWKYLDGEYSEKEFQMLRNQINNPAFEEQFRELVSFDRELSASLKHQAPDQLIPQVLKQTHAHAYMSTIKEYKALFIFLGFLVSLLIFGSFIPSKPSMLIEFIQKNPQWSQVNFGLDQAILSIFNPYFVCLLIIPLLYFVDKWIEGRFGKLRLGLLSY